MYEINNFGLCSLSGVVNLIKPDMVKPGACIIDVGINRITTEDGKTKLVGDVDYNGKKKYTLYLLTIANPLFSISNYF